MSKSPAILPNISLQPFNTFGVEAKASAYMEITSSQCLMDAIQDGFLEGNSVLVLGGGSNLLVQKDFNGLVLHMRNRSIKLIRQTAETFMVQASAGENWHDFVQWTLHQGMPGLENLSLIPGSVGASPIQNIGAYGVEVGEFIDSVQIIHLSSGRMENLDGKSCGFAYRDSIFKNELKGLVAVLGVTFALPRKWTPRLDYADVARELAAREWKMPTATQIAQAVIDIRKRKLPDPTVIGNAGSFFKNPVVSEETYRTLLAAHPGLVSYPYGDGSRKLAAGWLIDQCGWKGRRKGDAGVYEKQALVLVNHGNATGSEIAELAHEIQQDVFRHFGVQLEPEPVFV
ncbi:MAG: UDP-N-acetylenolpyruvoylglucosamine reductase [Paucimonas sp.]|jgi:UDP-N-acetylmuramate dehydrogenase|nr:UDP-N-acetylenolpyruvoylglucosamine reductase [Paucimonas sp.]